MEQKHIDEVEEDSFGEEFIDEDYPVLKVDKKKSAAASKPKAASASPGKKKEVVFDEDDFDEAEIQIKPVKVEPKAEPKTESISITPAVSSDPDKNNDNGGDDDMFKKVSTWTVISIVLLVLLIISIFSSGFGYGSSSAAVGEKITIDAAEEKVLNYVNTNLLAPPFVAEVKDKAELGNLYKFTLSVAGQEVESYVTLDGKLFFPRGFELNETTTAPAVEEAVVEAENVTAEANASDVTVTAPEVNTTAPVEAEPVETEPVEAEPEAAVPATETITEPVGPITPVKQLTQTVTAKKWLFDPNIITVKKGQSLKLTIKPVEIGEFTFSVSGLGIEKKVVGDTIIEFTPDKVGTYKFLCSTCEDWRGMTGNLVVS
ncbi:cupredoxin domain-containing protein [Candidatus Woesearchaeota archaeon]|nr:cupredoxin domain-containing protein [Candidatus Woesearchaeota archaeon]